jgi:hypothetical protein
MGPVPVGLVGVRGDLLGGGEDLLSGAPPRVDLVDVGLLLMGDLLDLGAPLLADSVEGILNLPDAEELPDAEDLLETSVDLLVVGSPWRVDLLDPELLLMVDLLAVGELLGTGVALVDMEVCFLGPPSSSGARGLFGNTLLDMEYVSPSELHAPPQKIPLETHCSMMFLNAFLQYLRSFLLSVLDTL